MVDYPHAGRYDEIFMDDRQRLMRQKPVTVKVAGTETLATIYTDRTKAVEGDNPFLTDIRGNGIFYANPGEYDLSYGGFTRRVSVTTDFEDLAVGSPGFPGSGAFSYVFQTSVVDSDPGAGGVKFNHATPSSVTEVYLDDVTFSGLNISGVVGSWDDSTSSVKGILEVLSQDQSEYVAFAVSSIVDGGTYSKISVSYLGSSGSFSASETVYVRFTRAGDKGTTGDTGPQGDVGPQGAVGPTGTSGGTAAPVFLPKYRFAYERWRSGDGVCTIVALGDSITEGLYAVVGGASDSAVYTEAGADTFVVPDNVTEVTVLCIGGGGGSGGSQAFGGRGAGGGGGAATQHTLAVTAGATINLSVGAGGTAGAVGGNGGAGGDTWFSSSGTVLAKGGAGGGGNGGTGGSGGLASGGIGDTKFDGGDGAAAPASTSFGGGGGGSAGAGGTGGDASGRTAGAAGADGGVVGATGADTNSVGVAGPAPGGGAGGAGSGAWAGAAGGIGMILVEWTISTDYRFRDMWTTRLGLDLARFGGHDRASVYVPACAGALIGYPNTPAEAWPGMTNPWNNDGLILPRTNNNGFGKRACSLTPVSWVEIYAPEWATHAVVFYDCNGSTQEITITSNNIPVSVLTPAGGAGTQRTEEFALIGSGNPFRVTMSSGLVGAQFHFAGVLFQDRSQGANNYIQVIESGHAGIRAEHYAAVDADTEYQWAEVIGMVDPDLVIIMLGVNDAQGGRTKAQFKADMNTVISKIDEYTTGNALGEPDLLLVMYPYLDASATEFLGIPGTFYSETVWNEYKDAVEEIVAALPAGRARYLDLSTWILPLDGPDHRTPDGSHPNKSLSWTIAQAMRSILAPFDQ